MIDPTEKGVVTRTQAVSRGSPKPFNISGQIISNLSAKTSGEKSNKAILFLDKVNDFGGR